MRPTPDRLREALFNIVAAQIEGSVFVDAYAGTGSVGIEALSRGAVRVVFLEKSKQALAVLVENLKGLEVGSRSRVILGPAVSGIASLKASIVFLDPPYEMPEEYAAALSALGKNPPPLVIAQHDRRVKLEERYGDLKRMRELKQGGNMLSFFQQDRPRDTRAEQPPSSDGSISQ